MQSSAASYHLFPVRSKYSPQHPVERMLINFVIIYFNRCMFIWNSTQKAEVKQYALRHISEVSSVLEFYNKIWRYIHQDMDQAFMGNAEQGSVPENTNPTLLSAPNQTDQQSLTSIGLPTNRRISSTPAYIFHWTRNTESPWHTGKNKGATQRICTSPCLCNFTNHTYSAWLRKQCYT
jgi:hypothetical protein